MLWPHEMPAHAGAWARGAMFIQSTVGPPHQSDIHLRPPHEHDQVTGCVTPQTCHL